MTGIETCAACGEPLVYETLGSVCQRCLLQAGLRSREHEIRLELVQIPSPADRMDYVREACSDDPALRDRVLAWLTRTELAISHSGVQSALENEEAGWPLDGRYCFVKQIGEGGFGTVYLAEQVTPVRRLVAVKMLKLGMDTGRVAARFELERQALAMMDHPNISKVYDAGATRSGRPYFVMEWVQGVPITEFCRSEALPLRRRLELLIDVCGAIQHAHQKGIIHRDLKPSNILVTLRDGLPVPKVIDFGIAKATQQDLTDDTVVTQVHQFLGTPAYISPEQAAMSGVDIDTRSDIYSLGVLLYELLTGLTPFDAQELVASGIDGMQRTIREKEPPRPSTRLMQALRKNPDQQQGFNSFLAYHASQIAGDLDWIVMKCLEKDRNRRYQTANGLAMDLQRHLDHEPVVARPPSTLYRLSKLVRRNPVVTSLGVLLFLALSAGLAAGIVLAVETFRAKRESDVANSRLSETVRYLESEKIEEQVAGGQRSKPLAWLARLLRDNPNDPVAASRALSMLSLHNFALPLGRPFVHEGQVNSARFSPDGAEILTASDDGTVRFWEPETGRRLREMTHTVGVAEAAYLAQETRLVVVTVDRTARVYDTASGGLLFEARGLRWSDQWGFEDSAGRHAFAVHQSRSISRWDLGSGGPLEPPILLPSAIRTVDYSASRELLAVGGEDRSVHVFQLPDGRPLVPPWQFDVPVETVRFTPDGRRLFISLSKGHRLAIWETGAAGALREFIPPAPIRMEQMLFTPDGRRLLTFNWGAPLRLWDAETLEPATRTIDANLQGLVDYRPSDDSSLVVAYAQCGTVRIFDLHTTPALFEPLEHHGAVRDLRFHANDARILTASQDGTARLWNIRMRTPPPIVFPSPSGGGEASFNHEGNRVVLSVHRHAVQVCDARTGRPLSPLLQHPVRGGLEHIPYASFSPDDTRILTVGEEGLVRAWDAASFDPVLDLETGRDVVRARYSPDGQFIVVGSRDGAVDIWNAHSGERLSASAPNGYEVTTLNFDPRGGAVVAGWVDGMAQSFRLPTGELLAPPLRHQGIVWHAAYSPDGTRIVTASADRSARVWDSRTSEPLLKPVRHEKGVFLATFSPDGERILTTSDDATARVWNARTGEPVSPSMQHASRIWMGAFSPDGRLVATGSDDRTVRLWDPESGLPMSEPLAHSGLVGRLAFSPDGQRLLSFGGEVRLWDVVVAPTPVPEWFCDLLEAVAGFRLAPDGQIELVSPDILPALIERAATTSREDFYWRWAKWFLLDRMQEQPPAFELGPWNAALVQHLVGDRAKNGFRDDVVPMNRVRELEGLLHMHDANHATRPKQRIGINYRVVGPIRQVRGRQHATNRAVFSFLFLSV